MIACNCMCLAQDCKLDIVGAVPFAICAGQELPVIFDTSVFCEEVVRGTVMGRSLWVVKRSVESG